MQPQLSLLEPLTTPGAVPLWSRLDETTRTEARRRLARLIAKIVVPSDDVPADDHQEHGDD